MGAHPRRALHDRLLQRAPRPRVNVILGEGEFCGGDGFDRFLERAGLAGAALRNARLVEMDMSFDKTRNHEASVQHELAYAVRCSRFKLWADGGDAAVAHADIDRLVLEACDASVAQDGIEHADDLLRRGGVAEISGLDLRIAGKIDRAIFAHDLAGV